MRRVFLLKANEFQSLPWLCRDRWEAQMLCLCGKTIVKPLYRTVPFYWYTLINCPQILEKLNILSVNVVPALTSIIMISHTECISWCLGPSIMRYLTLLKALMLVLNYLKSLYIFIFQRALPYDCIRCWKAVLELCPQVRLITATILTLCLLFYFF